MRYSDHDWRTMEAEDFRKDDLRRAQHLARTSCRDVSNEVDHDGACRRCGAAQGQACLEKQHAAANRAMPAAEPAALRILTYYRPSPLPVRDFDWSAVDDASYDGEGCPIGHGATESEAIADLMEQIEERRT